MELLSYFSRLLQLAIFVAIPIAAYETFQDKIPNGKIVPHPCRQNEYWPGVGHVNLLGGGQRNAFGLAFYAAGKTWTKALCESDSDGDGSTNGHELGDPECIWNEGDTPSRQLDITHPGICDPYGGLQCGDRNDWVNCEQGKFKCDAINEPATQSLEMKFDNETIPEYETTYECMMFDLPADQDYHIIAATPIIDTIAVVHHILVWACDPRTEAEYRESGVPYRCDMAPHYNCLSAVITWTLGMDGTCFQDDVGVLFGLMGYRKIAIQVHWNNKFRQTGLTDSSGMKIYYEPKTRPNDVMTFMVGQTYLRIDPEDKRKEIKGSCSSDCSRLALGGSVKLIEIWNHMHYQGREALVRVYRNGSLYQQLAEDPEYMYDSPQRHPIAPPLELLPGDEIELTCVFTGEGLTKTTYYGDATSDEMCFSFLTVYPATNVFNPLCHQWKGIPECRLYDSQTKNNTINGCKRTAYEVTGSDSEVNALSADVASHCRKYEECTPECLKATEKFYDHSCFNGEIWDFIRTTYGYTFNDFMLKLHSCDFEIRSKYVKPECPVSSAGLTMLTPTMTVMLLFASVYQLSTRL